MESAAELEKELVNAKEELELMARKERESRVSLYRDLMCLVSLETSSRLDSLQTLVQCSDISPLRGCRGF